MRWFHWVNFPVLTVMIWSGMIIYWASDTYKIEIGKKTYFHFFPDGFYKFFHLSGRLAEGMQFHFLFMWVFALNGVAYVFYTLISGEWRSIVPHKKSFKEALLVTLYDFHIIKKAPPQGKYNAAQRIAYTSIIIMGVGSLITGLAIYKPVQLYWLCYICGGYHFARIIHFTLTIGFCLFFVVHIVQVILAGWQNFSSVVTGFEVMKEKKETKPETETNLPAEDGKAS